MGKKRIVDSLTYYLKNKKTLSIILSSISLFSVVTAFFCGALIKEEVKKVVNLIQTQKVVSGIYLLLCIVIVVFVHELGHICVAKAFSIKTFGLEFSRKGIFPSFSIQYAITQNTLRIHLKLFFSGIVFCFLLAGLATVLYIKTSNLFLFILLCCSEFDGIFNLLPLPGLDGYKVFSVR